MLLETLLFNLLRISWAAPIILTWYSPVRNDRNYIDWSRLNSFWNFAICLQTIHDSNLDFCNSELNTHITFCLNILVSFTLKVSRQLWESPIENILFRLILLSPNTVTEGTNFCIIVEVSIFRTSPKIMILKMEGVWRSQWKDFRALEGREWRL